MSTKINLVIFKQTKNLQNKLFINQTKNDDEFDDRKLTKMSLLSDWKMAKWH